MKRLEFTLEKRNFKLSPSLKLAASLHLKMDVEKTKFLLGPGGERLVLERDSESHPQKKLEKSHQDHGRPPKTLLVDFL